ncbi:MAG: hypothetical protein JWM95_5395 [Gemmatimonadetes bacterium]|nr:hypothetical protein [Gemmatimonadota bacterium]
MRNADAVHLPGFSDWADLSGALIHGLSHAFTNRIASLTSYMQLMKFGEGEFSADVFLPVEIQRLQDLNIAMRLLIPRDEQPSAMELAPLLREALALHSHHGSAYAQETELVVTGEALPVRIAPSDLISLLLLLIDQSSTHHRQRGETRVVHTLVCEDLTVALHLSGAGPVTPYMTAVAAECGAQLATTAGGVSLTLPTLLALRMR